MFKSQSRLIVLVGTWALLALGCRVSPSNPSAADGSLSESKAPFSFAVISDTHVLPGENEPVNKRFTRMGQLFDTLEPRPDFVVDTGDCVDDLFCLKSCKNPLQVLTQFRSLIEQSYSMPFYVVLGNHDNRYLDTWDGNEAPLASWESVFGETKMFPSPYYVFRHNGWKFIALFSQELAHDHASNDLASFSEEQLNFLQKQLADGTPSVVFYHIYLDPAEEAAKSVPNPIMPILAAHKENVKAVFAGHRHRFTHTVWNGIEFYQTASIKNTEKLSYHIVDVNTTEALLSIRNRDEIVYETVNP